MLERKRNFTFGLADAREDAFARVAARRDDALQLARAHDVKTRAQIGERAQDGEVGVRLHRKADEVIHRRERAVKLLEMIRQRAL